MRWLIGIIAALLLAAGGLYAIGQFVLAPNLVVTRTVVIERPRATVFAMVDDLKIVKEWSPNYALDPETAFYFSGPDAGDGQVMRWVSQDRSVGRGQMQITGAKDLSRVDAVISLSDNRVDLASAIVITPDKSGGSRVSWTISAGCAAGAINIPCRYVNLFLKSEIGQRLESGLKRLKTLAEQVSPVDFEGMKPDFVTVQPRPYLYADARVSGQRPDPSEVLAAIETGRGAVEAFMKEHQLTPTGPLMVVTTGVEPDRFDFRVGYPFSGPAPARLVGIQAGETPAGRAMRVVHDGPRADMRVTYEKAQAYLQAHYIEVRGDGLPWEVYQTPAATAAAAPSIDAMRVEIYLPVQ